MNIQIKKMLLQQVQSKFYMIMNTQKILTQIIFNLVFVNRMETLYQE